MLNEIKKELGITNKYMFVLLADNKIVHCFVTCLSLDENVIESVEESTKKMRKTNNVLCINVVRLDD